MDEYALLAEERMEKSILNLQSEFSTLRTGRASAALLDRIECDYYGEKMPINQISSISVPEPRQLLIKPYDKGDMRSILAAINASTLGINPINDGDTIRLILPPLTEERRRDLVKQAKKFTEEAKIAIRNIRRDANTSIKNDKDLSEDMSKRAEEAVQKVTDEYVKKADDLLKEKEEEILTV
ncbi:MAG: ribosome recycling factor [Bacilli bacterium]|jgi:ribosome recycling factor|nr:ribosome recycling factor [Bacillota bacterium]NLI51952.1 ribosome recycling factor [Erysipelotrichaceae bacterium]OQC49816.1 MAG: Ribosome-recycling factor [Tenericutes bacterium ADurb.Bin024]HOE53726.1 ribosome recycling factor [Bacilli bacterium]TAH58816.1 MAG: ribosome recycling factor [Bacillota bacterium]